MEVRPHEEHALEKASVEKEVRGLARPYKAGLGWQAARVGSTTHRGRVASDRRTMAARSRTKWRAEGKSNTGLVASQKGEQCWVYHAL